jgi:hypothetical protein
MARQLGRARPPRASGRALLSAVAVTSPPGHIVRIPNGGEELTPSSSQDVAPFFRGSAREARIVLQHDRKIIRSCGSETAC